MSNPFASNSFPQSNTNPSAHNPPKKRKNSWKKRQSNPNTAPNSNPFANATSSAFSGSAASFPASQPNRSSKSPFEKKRPKNKGNAFQTHPQSAVWGNAPGNTQNVFGQQQQGANVFGQQQQKAKSQKRQKGKKPAFATQPSNPFQTGAFGGATSTNTPSAAFGSTAPSTNAFSAPSASSGFGVTSSGAFGVGSAFGSGQGAQAFPSAASDPFQTQQQKQRNVKSPFEKKRKGRKQQDANPFATGGASTGSTAFGSGSSGFPQSTAFGVASTSGAFPTSSTTATSSFPMSSGFPAASSGAFPSSSTTFPAPSSNPFQTQSQQQRGQKGSFQKGRRQKEQSAFGSAQAAPAFPSSTPHPFQKQHSTTTSTWPSSTGSSTGGFPTSSTTSTWSTPQHTFGSSASGGSTFPTPSGGKRQRPRKDSQKTPFKTGQTQQQADETPILSKGLHAKRGRRKWGAQSDVDTTGTDEGNEQQQSRDKRYSSRDKRQNRFEHGGKKKGKFEKRRRQPQEEVDEHEEEETPAEETYEETYEDEDANEQTYDDEDYSSKPFTLPKGASSLIFTTGGLAAKSKPAAAKPSPKKSFSLDDLEEEPAQNEEEQQEYDEEASGETYADEEETYAEEEGETYAEEQEGETYAEEEGEYDAQYDEEYGEEPVAETFYPPEPSSTTAQPTTPSSPFAKNDPLNALDTEVRAILTKAHKTHTRGTCMTMCPPAEIKAREFERALSKYEIDYSYTPSGPHDKHRANPKRVVKAYAKASAGTSINPSVIRPLPVLKRTMDYLVHKIFGRDDHGLIEMYSFIRDRCRGINQDLTLQNADSLEAVDLLERITRFHIVSEYLFCEEKDFSHQIVQNMQLLNKYLISLAELYRDLRAKGISSEREVEFHGYMIISLMDDKDKPPKDRLELVQYLKMLPADVLATPHMQKILKLYSYFKQQNFYKFFEHAQKFDFLTLCQLNRVLSPTRMQALLVFKKAFRNVYSLEDLVDYLKFSSTAQAVNFLKVFNIKVKGDKVSLSDSVPEKSYSDLPFNHSYWIDGKKPADMSYAELLDGKLWEKNWYSEDFRKRAVRMDIEQQRRTTPPVGKLTETPADGAKATPPITKEAVQTSEAEDSSTIAFHPGENESPRSTKSSSRHTTPSPIHVQVDEQSPWGTTTVDKAPQTPINKVTTPHQKSPTQSMPPPQSPLFDLKLPLTPTLPRESPKQQVPPLKPTFEFQMPPPPSLVDEQKAPSSPARRPRKQSPPKPTREEIIEQRLQSFLLKRHRRIMRFTLAQWRQFTAQRKEERRQEEQQRLREQHMRENYLHALSDPIQSLHTVGDQHEYLYGTKKSHYIRPLDHVRAREERHLEELFFSPLEFASHVFYPLVRTNINVNTQERDTSNEIQWKLSVLHSNDQEMCVWLRSKLLHTQLPDDRFVYWQRFRGNNITIRSVDAMSEEDQFEWYLKNMCDDSGVPLYDNCTLSTCVREIRLKHINQTQLQQQLRGSAGLVYILPLPTLNSTSLDAYWNNVVHSQLRNILSAINVSQLERQIPLVVLFDSILFSRAEVLEQIQRICSKLPAQPKVDIAVAVIDLPFSVGLLSKEQIDLLESCLVQCATFIAQRGSKQPHIRSMLLSDFVEECVSAHFDNVTHCSMGIEQLCYNNSVSIPEYSQQHLTLLASAALQSIPPPPVAFSNLIEHVNRVVQHCALSIEAHFNSLATRLNWPPPELVNIVHDWAAPDYHRAVQERLADFLIHLESITVDMGTRDLIATPQQCFERLFTHCTQFAANLLGASSCPAELESDIAHFVSSALRCHWEGVHDVNPTIYVDLFRTLVNYFFEHEDDHKFPVVHTLDFHSDVVREIFGDVHDVASGIPLVPHHVLEGWDEDNSSYVESGDESDDDESSVISDLDEDAMEFEMVGADATESEHNVHDHVVHFVEPAQLGKRKRMPLNGDLCGASTRPTKRPRTQVRDSLFAQIDAEFDRLMDRIESECEECDKWSRWLEQEVRRSE